MSEDDKVAKAAQIIGQKVAEALKGQWETEDPFANEVGELKNKLIVQPQPNIAVKSLVSVPTGTFLDRMFLDSQDQPINGIPMASNAILVGIPSSGKSLFIYEVALRLANSGRKTVLITTEDIWQTESSRYDLQSRLLEKAKALNLNWQKVSENLFIVDVVAHPELRDFDTFIKTYRFLVENEKAEVILMDSLTQLEDSRNTIKFRLLEICRYNQNHGVTAIFVSQRSTDDPDSLAFSGGLAIGYMCDIVMELDFKRLSSWDKSIKEDTGIPQGQVANFFRILKCRLCKYRVNYFLYQINDSGMVRLMEKSTEKL